MDELNGAYLEDAARGIWHYLGRGGACELAFRPGNGTMYDLLFTSCAGLNRARDWMDHEWARSITDDRPELIEGATHEWLLLSWMGHGCWPVDLSSVWAEPYFVEKFADCTRGDAYALRKLLLAVAHSAGISSVAIVR